MTETIQQLKEDIAILQEKLQKLEEIENHKTPCEIAYRDAYGSYPVTDDMSGGDMDYVSWSAFQKGYDAAYEEKVSQEPEENEWKSVALRFGEKLSDVGPNGYYELSPSAWFRWAVFTYGKTQHIKDTVRESVKWCEEHPDKDPLDCLKFQTEKKVEKPQKREWTIEKLLENNFYVDAKELLKSNLEPKPQTPKDDFEDDKKMEELGFVKNSDGSWTAQPLVETSQEQVKKLQEKDWEIKVETDYLTGKARHKTKIVDKDGNDYKPEPEMLLLRQGKVDFVDYDGKYGKKYIRIEYTDSFAGEYSWYVRRIGEDAVRPVRDVNVYAPLEELYQKEVVKQKDDYPYKKYTPEETEKSLKEAFVKAQQTEKWKELQRKIDEEDNDKNFKNSLDLIKEWGEKNKPPTLYQLIENWWCDVFCANSMDDMETCIDGLVDRIDNQFIPPLSDSNSYEWEKCLKMMREKLR